MQFFISKSENKLSLDRTMRAAGYSLNRFNREEPNFTRPLAGALYPRFHIYVKENTENYIGNIHLDQKQTSYEGSGSHAHSGDYDGEIIEREIARIKEAIHKTQETKPVPETSAPMSKNEVSSAPWWKFW
jgi:hypothetical protein